MVVASEHSLRICIFELTVRPFWKAVSKIARSRSL
jgi:hypothetical protein